MSHNISETKPHLKLWWIAKDSKENGGPSLMTTSTPTWPQPLEEQPLPNGLLSNFSWTTVSSDQKLTADTSWTKETQWCSTNNKSKSSRTERDSPSTLPPQKEREDSKTISITLIKRLQVLLHQKDNNSTSRSIMLRLECDFVSCEDWISFWLLKN